jgi:hypothetical protein
MFTLVTFGKGGWTFNDVYNMPVYLRNMHFREMEKIIAAENTVKTPAVASKVYTPPQVR